MDTEFGVSKWFGPSKRQVAEQWGRRRIGITKTMLIFPTSLCPNALAGPRLPICHVALDSHHVSSLYVTIIVCIEEQRNQHISPYQLRENAVCMRKCFELKFKNNVYVRLSQFRA